MKVLQLIHNLRAEGAQRVVVNLVAATSSIDIEQQVCAWRAGGPLALQIRAQSKQSQSKNVPLIVGDQAPLHGKSWVGRLFYLRQLIRHKQIDLVHAHLSDAVMMAAFLKYLTGVPFIITHHCPEYMPPDLRGLKARVYAGVVRWAVRQATTHIAISPVVQQAVVRSLRLQRANWKVIANGVPLPDITKALALPFAFPFRFKKKPLLITVGRLDSVKDFAQLIAAMPSVLAVMPEVRLAIVGDGPLRTQLQNQVDGLQLQDQIELVGMSTEIDAWLQHASVFVSCSFYEGVPMALLEAMVYGLPVVVSDVTGNRDVVEHLRTGWLYDKASERCLTAALLAALQDCRQAQQFGQAAAIWVRGHCSQDAMGTAYHHLYQHLSFSR